MAELRRASWCKAAGPREGPGEVEEPAPAPRRGFPGVRRPLATPWWGRSGRRREAKGCPWCTEPGTWGAGTRRSARRPLAGVRPPGGGRAARQSLTMGGGQDQTSPGAPRTYPAPGPRSLRGRGRELGSRGEPREGQGGAGVLLPGRGLPPREERELRRQKGKNARATAGGEGEPSTSGRLPHPLQPPGQARRGTNAGTCPLGIPGPCSPAAPTPRGRREGKPEGRRLFDYALPQGAAGPPQRNRRRQKGGYATCPKAHRGEVSG